MVLLWGVAIATVLTLVVIPAIYALLGRFSQPAGVNSRALEAELGTDLNRYKK
jgi:multidrug efflux pump